MLQHSVNWDYQWAQIVGRAWADDNFNRRLHADPAGVLKEYDLPTPEGLRIEVLEAPDGVCEDTVSGDAVLGHTAPESTVPENTDGVMYLVLPGKPSSAELCEDDLHSLGGALSVARCGCGGCGCRGCGCGGCGGCVWCYYSPTADEN